MSTLRDIRRRLRSVENTKKITDAMERVAAAQLRRAQEKAEQSRPYILKMKEILDRLTLSEHNNPLFEQRVVKKRALIVISADRGLSGSYNSNLLSAADNFLKKQVENTELFLFGRKAIEHYKRGHWTVVEEFMGWGGKISLSEVKQFSDKLIDLFLTHSLDEVWVIYTQYVTLMNRRVVLEKLLNIAPHASEDNSTWINYIFEPNPEEILESMLPLYLATHLQAAFDEAYAAELAARIIAMQVASKNSQEMINDLTLIRNKVRQEGITKEIIEIATH